MENISPDTRTYLAALCGVDCIDDNVPFDILRHSGPRPYSFDDTPSPCTSSMLKELCNVVPKRRTTKQVTIVNPSLLRKGSVELKKCVIETNLSTSVLDDCSEGRHTIGKGKRYTLLEE